MPVDQGTRQLTEQAEELRVRGFTSVDDLIPASAVAELAEIYDEILAGDVDCGEDDRWLGGITRQVISPRRYHQGLADAAVYRAAERAATQLLGAEVEHLFDMMIFKPPGHDKETPWHQDYSYYRRPFTKAGQAPVNATVQIWIAVDDADVTNGCMHFIPDVHTAPLLPHYVFSGDPANEGRLLAIVDPDENLDLSTAEARPLPAGGATFHYEGTPHYTPPNRSTDRPRRAYIINFEIPGRVPIDIDTGTI